LENVGETFLSQHKDFGLDITYVSDYIDNHEQMISDLIEIGKNMQLVKNFGEEITKSQDESDRENTIENIEKLESKWNSLRKCVEKRVVLAKSYLCFLKDANELENLAMDIQELMDRFEDLSPRTMCSTENMLQQHLNEKLTCFEKLYESIIKKGNHLINELKIVSIPYIYHE
jgi:hypothetical protein